MIYIVQNLVPILVATLAGLAFGTLFQHLTANTGTKPGMIATAFVAEVWLCAILAGALILAPPKADPWIMAVGSAVVIWIGFVVPATVATLRYRSASAGGIARDCAHWLGVMVVQAVVLKAIGLVAPAGQ